MPFMKALSVSHDESGSESETIAVHPEHEQLPSSDRPKLHHLESILVNPDFVEPVQIALDDDARYRMIYDAYLDNGKVHPLANENEWFSIMRSRFRTGGLAGTPSERDYTDNHVALCSKSKTLTVKHWLIAHPTLVIDLSKVDYIRPAKDVVASGGVEAWGVGKTGIGWARDLDRLPTTGRNFWHSYVCQFQEWGDVFLAGFTVEDPKRFMKELQGIRPEITKVPMDEEVGEIS
ncbi:hypothetical protein DACRYDRAFT_19813 [Dacryopinax primogenitus]|uniref:Uncharacterized protein n=1 Tax=Dacryopinax primogenitus (strain DJM 731) TaxID=1858805 RepID=M5G932_DACPD|nr:uncharacterized protein DACRYDRAFT_19813 [Dacryopinax primogenitus]EJU05239.1 hypothetical protein DACRYDRAFT_19813 [Dacryopinax primogenitus]